MKIKFVGTSSGKTSLSRFHSSILLSIKNYNLLVDAGDGISRALLFNGINFNKIDGIIFTHFHPDHFSGFPALLVQMKMTDRKRPLYIFIHHSLKYVVEDSLLRSYLLPEKMKFDIQYRTFNDNEKIYISKHLSVVARKNTHLEDLEKYLDDHETMSLYSASLLLEEDEKKIIYTSDIASREDLLIFKEFVADIHIIEATHLPFSVLQDSIRKIEAGKIILTHYSDEDTPQLSEIMSTLSTELKHGFTLAIDGGSFEI